MLPIRRIKVFNPSASPVVSSENEVECKSQYPTTAAASSAHLAKNWPEMAVQFITREFS
jgi:hypothetical protein